MTANKVIEIVDGYKVNSYAEEDKFKWINDLDGMIQRTVFMNPTAESMVYPDDMDKELLVGHPFDEIYPLWVSAYIDYHNREYDVYNNAMLMFTEKFDAFKKAYIREHMPIQHGGFKL